MKLYEVAQIVGKSPNFLYMQKHANPEKFNFMMSFDSNYLISYRKYLAYVDELLEFANMKYYEVGQAKFLHKLVELELYASYNHALNAFSQNLYRNRELNARWEFIKKLIKIKEIYNETP